MKKLKLKIRSMDDFVDLKSYRWPNAFVALKGYYIYCFFRAEHQRKISTVVSPSFIIGILKGDFDESFPELDQIIKHPQKRDLQSIASTSFSDLVASNPKLIAGAFIQN